MNAVCTAVTHPGPKGFGIGSIELKIIAPKDTDLSEQLRRIQCALDGGWKITSSISNSDIAEALTIKVEGEGEIL